MTDIGFDAPEPRMPRRARFQKLANGLGAVLSAGLIAGMVFWSWKLAVRDVSGVPVVRALEGPMRVAPDDPGGMRAAYQGLAVNAVAAEGAAKPLPERIVLAPAPLTLDGALIEEEVAIPAPALDALPGLTDIALRPEAASTVPEPSPDGSTAGFLPDAAAVDAALQVALAIVPADVPGVRRSPVPPLRPTRDLVAETAARAAIAAFAPSAAVDVDPATLTPGTRLVQLGAYDDADMARAEWDRLAAQFEAVMSDKGRVIQQAESGGRAFFRLRAAGFADEAEARRFCAVLLAGDSACIPVLIR